MKPRGEVPGDPIRDDGRESGTDAAVLRMRNAIDAAARGGAAHAELEAAAIQLVETLKATNHPPEQMLLRIKQLLADAGLRPSYASPAESGASIGLEATMYRDVIAWSIRHYYGG